MNFITLINNQFSTVIHTVYLCERPCGECNIACMIHKQLHPPWSGLLYSAIIDCFCLNKKELQKISGWRGALQGLCLEVCS